MNRVLFLAATISIAAWSCNRPVSSTNAPNRVESRSSAPDTVSPDPLEPALNDASMGVDAPELQTLLREHWRWNLETWPLRATRLGIHRWDDRLSDPSLAARDQNRARRRAFLVHAQGIAVGRLSEADRVTRALFVRKMEVAIARERCRFDEWTVSARGNPVTRWNDLPTRHRIKTQGDADNLLARYRQISAHIDASAERLQLGAADGLFANAESTRRVTEMVDKQIAQPLDEWPLIEPAKTRRDWDATAWQANLRKVVAHEIRPALERYARVLKETVAPQARSAEQTGLAALPLGPACYDALILGFTSLPLTAAEVHELGLVEIARIDKEIAALGKKLFGARSLKATLKKLRTDPELYFETAQQVQAAAEEALDQAKQRMERVFGRLPRAECTVTPIPDYEAPFTTIAYYKQANPDGSKPGEYFINLHQPKTRPRFEARVLAVHESIPGHHLQIAVAQELPKVPAFRRHGGTTAFIEGWALYTERMAEEMGMYRDDLDRMGVLSYDAWRAGRLVVDTGIHAKGWSRNRAKKFLERHSALALNNIDNEVDRYISWPGQALAYKIGQLEIWKLRGEAEAALGDAFELKVFHDVVLGGGAVTLPILRARVESWVEGMKR